jgi:cytochrome c2/rhodanese-related sulfurtransferase
MTRVVAALMVVCVWLLAAQTRSPLLHPSRQAPTDLQVGESQFIPYQDLLRLPQVKFTTSEDSNFVPPAHVSGVPLDELKHSLAPDADMVVAICADGYRSNYPAAYLSAHHPVLVLTVNGEAQQGWPKIHEGSGELGPYVIANPAFRSSFKVLSHTDEAQIPFQVVRLDFRSEREVFGPIAPKGSYAPDSPVMQGYKIAQQNCYRCHNMGAEGGHMASIPWGVVGTFAKGNPDFFAKYVRNPRAVNPSSRMAASPGYDDETIAALRAYFSTFAAGGP